MANGAYKTSSCTLNVATVILFLVFVVHVIGFSKPRWVVVESYQGGLWQQCGYLYEYRFDPSQWFCFSRTNDLGWFKFVQAAETLGLIGLIVSMSLSLLLCFRQIRICKHVNIFLVITSGAVILVGAIVFVLKTKEDFGGLTTLLSEKHEDNWSFGYGLILCIVASCLCLLVCAPLYVIDLRSHTPKTSSEAPVHVNVIPPPQGNVQGGHPAGYAPLNFTAQPPPQDNVQGGQPAGYAPMNNTAQPHPQGNVQGGQPARYTPVYYTAQQPPQGYVQGGQQVGYEPAFYTAQRPPQGIVQGGQPTGYAPAFYTGQHPPQGNVQGGQPTGYAPLFYIAQPPPQGYVQGGQPAEYVPASALSQYGFPPASDQPDDIKIP